MIFETHPAFQRIEDTLFASARRSPDKTAIVDGDRTATYHSLASAAVALSHRLLEQGLQPGDRVSIFLDKSIESALAIGRLLQAFLFDVRPADPLALAAAAFVLTLAALIACCGPAWRAGRVDPSEALRQE